MANKQENNGKNLGQQVAALATQDAGFLSRSSQRAISDLISEKYNEMKSADPNKGKCGGALAMVFREKGFGADAPAHMIGIEFDAKGNVIDAQKITGAQDRQSFTTTIANSIGMPSDTTAEQINAGDKANPQGYTAATFMGANPGCKP